MEQTEQHPGANGGPDHKRSDNNGATDGPGSGDNGSAPDCATQDGTTETVRQLQQAVEEARAEAERQRENALRTRAEMDNLQKRLDRELDKSRRFALERIMGDLLPVVDSLEAALGSQQASEEQLREGAELILKMLNKLVADHGLKEINPLHQPFDPELHQAMSIQASDEHEPDTVVQVFQKGYQLHERLLRPALVVVSKPAAA